MAGVAIASAEIKQNAKILNRFISLLRRLNITNGALLQVSSNLASAPNLVAKEQMPYGATVYALRHCCERRFWSLRDYPKQPLWLRLLSFAFNPCAPRPTGRTSSHPRGSKIAARFWSLGDSNP